MERLKEEVEAQGKKIEELEDNNFVIDLYKEIIRLNKENADNQKKTLEMRENANNKLYKTLFTCIILIFVLVGVCCFLIGICITKDTKYNAFREQAITKEELIEAIQGTK